MASEFQKQCCYRARRWYRSYGTGTSPAADVSARIAKPLDQVGHQDWNNVYRGTRDRLQS